MCLGGECGRGGVIFDSGYSRAHCIGNHANVESAAAYLEPNRNTLQKPKRGRSLFAISAAISALKNSTAAFEPINRGGIGHREH